MPLAPQQDLDLELEILLTKKQYVPKEDIEAFLELCSNVKKMESIRAILPLEFYTGNNYSFEDKIILLEYVITLKQPDVIRQVIKDVFGVKKSQELFAGGYGEYLVSILIKVSPESFEIILPIITNFITEKSSDFMLKVITLSLNKHYGFRQNLKPDDMQKVIEIWRDVLVNKNNKYYKRTEKWFTQESLLYVLFMAGHINSFKVEGADLLNVDWNLKYNCGIL